MILFLSIVQLSHSQEDGVVALSLPVRNSLKFNKYAINPTFSFVREQNKYITFTNKREWVQFDNAPQTYLFSYSGRFSENTGIGVGLFQQNYGVLTTFGGVLNYAYNVVLERDSNLTFGLNLGAYKSGINEGSVVTNFPDPSLDNIPSNTVITINPGINYGLAFFDLGVSVNNLVSYNLTTSKLIEDNPEQSVQGHVMYTGYVNSRGFFDETKFSGLVRSEFKKDQTVISGIAMFTVPKGFWAQAGYNTLYGFSGGVGFNISSQIALEYNYEKAMGNLSMFGSSHEITLAYKFKNRNRYNYSGDDDESALIAPVKKSKSVAVKSQPTTRTVRNTNLDTTAEDKAKAEEAARVKLEQEQAKAQVDEAARVKLEQAQVKTTADEAARVKLEQAQAKAKADEAAKIELEQAQAKVQVDEAARVKLEQAQAKTTADEAARVKLEQAQAKTTADEAARVKLEQEQAQVKADEAARIKLEQAQSKAKADEAARIKLEQAQAKAQADEAARVKLEQEQAQVKADEAARIKLEQAQAKAKADEEAKIKLEQAQVKAKADEEARIRLAEEQAKARAKEINDSIAQINLDDVLVEGQRKNTNETENTAPLTSDSSVEQHELLIKLRETVASKEKDLKDLKQENDLSEQGIYSEPKPFKSVSAENAAIESLKIDIENVIKTQNAKIRQMEDLYNRNANADESTRASYLSRINALKAEQLQAVITKDKLLATLNDIKEATEIERKRRIKRAVYDNEQDRYTKDRAALNVIKQNTPLSTVPLKEGDFDFGEEQSKNIQILKGVSNVENGYYMVLAVHSDINKRDEFLTKVVASGQSNINFFYDVNTSKYYIYYEKFDSVEAANNALKSNENEPYNKKRSMIKIEN